MTEISPIFRLAHISDLHFSRFTCNPTQFFSKRWIGNANLLLRRMKEFCLDGVLSLPETLHAQNVQAVLITGDISTTSRECEFLLAKEFLQKFKQLGMEVILLPGNHDHYTKKSYQNQTFYQYFATELKHKKVFATKLTTGYWLIRIDTTLATGLLCCHGYFSPDIEKELSQVLQEIPSEDTVLLANHFPLFSHKPHKPHLQRDVALRSLLSRFPQVKFYLHGHTHHHHIADLRNAHLPILLDSGCVSHKHKGSWNLLELQENGCQVSPFMLEKQKIWIKKPTISFNLSSRNI